MQPLHCCFLRWGWVLKKAFSLSSAKVQKISHCAKIFHTVLLISCSCYVEKQGIWSSCCWNISIPTGIFYITSGMCMNSSSLFLSPPFPPTGSSRSALWSGSIKTSVPVSSASAAPRWCDRSSKGWVEITTALWMTLEVNVFLLKMPLWAVYGLENKCKGVLNSFFERFVSFFFFLEHSLWNSLCLECFNPRSFCDNIYRDYFTNTVLMAFQQRDETSLIEAQQLTVKKWLFWAAAKRECLDECEANQRLWTC